MSWFFDVAPYVLACGAIALGAFEIIKDWKDYKDRRLRISVATVFIVVAFVSILSLHHDNAEKAAAAKKAEGDMRTLQAKVDTANDAQKENTSLFLKSLEKMSGQVSDLKTEVKTEALQKKLASVQAELQKTQRAMEPGPKAELAFSFEPFPNPFPPSKAELVKDVTAPLNVDGSVHADFTVVNMTTAEATNVEVELVICDLCKYTNEPAGFTKLPGIPETHRYLAMPYLHPMEKCKTLSVDVTPPPGSLVTGLFFQYRCHGCALQRGVSATSGTIHIQRIPNIDELKHTHK
jgi:hypothetical protein